MTDTQPRTPAGSPVGGQFAAKPGGAEAAVELAGPSPADSQLADELKAVMMTVAPDIFRDASVSCTVEIEHQGSGASIDLKFAIKFPPTVGPVDQELGRMLASEMLSRIVGEANTKMRAPAANAASTTIADLAKNMTFDDIDRLVKCGASKYPSPMVDETWYRFDDEGTLELLEERFPEEERAAVAFSWDTDSLAVTLEREVAKRWVGYSGEAATAVRQAAYVVKLYELIGDVPGLFTYNNVVDATAPLRLAYPDANILPDRRTP